ncbi:hypothetical protein [Metabacillus fastidiosus]|uniref:hypothetical protein n=1 Tax=Metabacillus fastidiosus TaxID=1458 RepID=UPI0008245D7D|nr:hypothetical protein [Metabacillus fastidiosus]MED4462459.1 hypothetical protein [Metabacillus fastidiosus]
MKKWWNKKKDKMRKRRKDNDNYTFVDFILDVLFWIPELIILPFRLVFWLIRGVGRFIFDIF